MTPVKKKVRKDKRPLARKVKAVERVREGKQKKTKTPAHIEDERHTVPATGLPDELAHVEDVDLRAVGEAQYAQEAHPEWMNRRAQQAAPSQMDNLEKQLYCVREEMRAIGRSIVPDVYREQYGREGNCGDMVAHILNFRTLDEIEVFVYEKTGKAYPGLNPGQRRMNCGNLIRGLVNRLDADTMTWLLATSPR